MRSLRHIIARLYLYFLFSLFFVTGGLAMLVLAPLYKAAFAPLAPVRDLRVLDLWVHMYRVVWRTVSDKNYRSMYSSKISDPPKLHTDRSLVRIKDSWHGAENDCDVCKAACCVQLKCPLLGQDGRCLGYGSLFFTYFYCGRYPENQSQIDYYDCPKWELNNEA